jgi:Zn-dependent protease
MDLSPEKLRFIVEYMIIFVLSVAVHEFGHAYVADKLGDRLPRSQGRVTLNADPIGTLLLPGALLLLGSGSSIPFFAWGKPVQVQPAAFTRRFAMRTGHMMVAFAGPAMNVILAVIIGLIAVVLTKTQVIDYTSPLYAGLHRAILVNCSLCVFNLLPAAPLDGYTVVDGFLPARFHRAWESYARYGVFVLLAIMFIPQLRALVMWPAVQLYVLLTSVMGL